MTRFEAIVASAPAPLAVPRPAWRRGLACALAGLLLAACAETPVEEPESYDLTRASRLFTEGYQDIADIYIEDVEISALARAGLEGLADLDPGLTVRQDARQLVLLRDGQTAGSFDLPNPETAKQWGALTASALESGRAASPDLAEADAERLYQAVFDGIVGELDGFSRYAGREEARENRASRDGFGGIGVVVRAVDEGILVVSVMKGTPAEKAGLNGEDVIIDIDGKSAVGLPQVEVIRRLRGPIRTKVTLLIRRAETAAPLEIAVTRALIVPQTVEYRAEEGIGFLRVTGFNQSTARNLRAKLKLARREMGDELLGFVIDLRGNPGGLLDQAVVVADLFVEVGQIVSTHGRHPDSFQYFDAQSDDLADGHPIVVLTDGGSASASEIVAAALQDSHRAVLVGTNTFGKGTVQNVIRLPNEGEFTLTWARFHAPSGYSLQERGVLPDICTSGETGSLGEVLSKLDSGEFPLRRQVDLGGTGSEGEQSAQIAALRASCPRRNGDPELDLEVARTLLRDPALYERALGRKAESALIHLSPGPSLQEVVCASSPADSPTEASSDPSIPRDSC